MSDIPLPPPAEIPATLSQALRRRRSLREYSAEPVSLRDLATLLWAAQGVTSPRGRRTAPSAHDVREISCYALTAEGTWRYDPDTHSLVDTGLGDIRAQSGAQAIAATCPLDLVYVVDYLKCAPLSDNRVERLVAIDTGMIAQNVCLACAALGLSTVTRANFHVARLAVALGLPADSSPVLTQSVGHPL